MLLVAVVVVIALVLLRGVMVKALLEQQFLAATGLEAHIGKVDLSLFTPSITLQDVRIVETPEFAGVRFADIAEIHAVYDRSALADRRLRFKLVRINIRDLHLVESLQGKFNTGRFTTGLSGSRAGGSTSTAWRWVSAEVFNLTIDKLQYTSLKRPQDSQRAVLGMENEIILNVESALPISNAVLSRMLQKGIVLGAPPKSSTPPEGAVGR